MVNHDDNEGKYTDHPERVRLGTPQTPGGRIWGVCGEQPEDWDGGTVVVSYGPSFPHSRSLCFVQTQYKGSHFYSESLPGVPPMAPSLGLECVRSRQVTASDTHTGFLDFRVTGTRRWSPPDVPPSTHRGLSKGPSRVGTKVPREGCPIDLTRGGANPW